MARVFDQKVIRSAAAGTLIGFGALAGGCNNAAEGTLSGAALGAGAGAVIGSFFGAAGTGAAVGAVGGALGGGIIGDQNERNSGQQYSRGPRTWSDYRNYDW